MLTFLSKLPLVFVMSLVMALAAAPGFTASAHGVTPLTASPASGEVLPQAPTQVILTFEEEISEDGSTLQVFDEQGKQVDQGNGGVDLNDAEHATLIVSLPELGAGVYLVKWEVTLPDGDTSQGEYHFGIGNVSVPADSPGEGAADPPPSTGSPIVLWIILGVGLIVIALVVGYFIRKTSSNG